ncbi:MAG: c-type cytochrome, partial [Proteobacteria bacterium]|nr:c-type cytochrome [Pseudomonadota bacterium]
MTTQQLKELFSDSRFLGQAFSVTNRADGTRRFEANDYYLNLRWWVDAAGRFCTDTRSGMELCGIAHALMRFRVIVMEQADFDSWAAAYGEPPAITDKAKKGKQIFAANCTLCHTIDGPDDPALAASRLKGFRTGGDITPGPAPNLTDPRTRAT